MGYAMTNGEKLQEILQGGGYLCANGAPRPDGCVSASCWYIDGIPFIHWERPEGSRVIDPHESMAASWRKLPSPQPKEKGDE